MPLPESDPITGLTDEQRARIYEQERERRAAGLPKLFRGLGARLRSMPRWTFIATAAVILIVVGSLLKETSGAPVKKPAAAVASRSETPSEATVEPQQRVSGTVRRDPSTPLRFVEVQSDVSAYLLNHVVWRGKVEGAITPQDAGGIGFIVQDPDTQGYFVARWNTAPANHGIKPDAWVEVNGVIRSVFDGKNGWGASMSMPDVTADSVRVISRAEAVAPANSVVKVGVSKSAIGLALTVDRVEFANDETRVYLHIRNDGASKVSFSAYSAKLTQGKRQFERKNDYLAPDEAPQDELMPGIETDGYLMFPVIDPEPKALTLFLGNAWSENPIQFTDLSIDFTI
jgi:hypothetical protein